MGKRVVHTEVERLIIGIPLRSAKARALALDRAAERTPSVLARVATNLTREPLEPVFGLERVVTELAELLTAPAPRGVLLVGPSGVGKTAAVRELARRRAEYGLGATPFWATSGARLVAGMCGYGMWQERCRQMVREANRSRAIVHLGGLVELMQVGKSEYNALGVAAFLRPSLARGELLAICECTPEQLPLVERDDPHLLAAFHPLPVAEPDAEQARAILRHVAANTPFPDGRPLDDAALDSLDRLHRRYAGYSAYPGRPLRFLRGLLRDCRLLAALAWGLNRHGADVALAAEVTREDGALRCTVRLLPIRSLRNAAQLEQPSEAKNRAQQPFPFDTTPALP